MSAGWRRLACGLSWLLFALSLARAAGAHQIDAATLSLREVSAGRFLVKWQASSPSLQDAPMDPAVFPAPCRFDGQYLDCGPAGMLGTVAFPWLEGTLTHVILDIEWQDHTHLLRTITASAPSLSVYRPARAAGFRAFVPLALDYCELGIEHILTGFDHLLFVVALILLVRGRRLLLATVTAFTLAHSLSLASTVLGLVHLPPPPVEAAIALSIVLVCAECLRPDDSLTRRAPWLVAFAFGLLHGLGFASALLEIGLPESHVPLALLCFNLGVELGQLAVIALVTALVALSERLGWRRAWLRPSLVYIMGSVAACWTLERLPAVFGR